MRELSGTSLADQLSLIELQLALPIDQTIRAAMSAHWTATTQGDHAEPT